MEDYANPCLIIEVWSEEGISSDSPGEAEETCGETSPLEQDTKSVAFGGARPKVSMADGSC